jgi:hypothetical protein
MTKATAKSKSNLILNLFIGVFLTIGVLDIGGKTIKLISNRDEINIVRIDVPWFHPTEKVAILFDRSLLVGDSELYQDLNTGIYTFDLIKRALYLPLLVLILVLLKRLIISIRASTFFEDKNIQIINQLALVVGAYVFLQFISYQVVTFLIPEHLMEETINFTTLNESILENIVAALDFKMLFVAVILYVVSVSFKQGYQLKQESELTI